MQHSGYQYHGTAYRRSNNGRGLYKDKAEKLILEIKKKEEENSIFLLRLETIIGILSTVLALAIIFIAAFLNLGTMIMFILILSEGIYFYVNIEHNAGYYECRACHHRYVPDFSHIVI